MKELLLTVTERVTLSFWASKHQSGNRIEAMLVYDLMQLSMFTPKEIEEFGIEEQNGFIECKINGEIPVNLSDKQLAIITSWIDELEADGSIHHSSVPLIRKIDKLFKIE